MSNQPLIASGDVVMYTITVGNSGQTYGYDTFIPVGSVSPSLIVLPYDSAHSLQVAISNTAAGWDFSVQADTGGRPQGAFAYLQVFDQTGAWRTYTSAAATYTSGNSQWTWGTGSSMVWTATGTRYLIIY